MEKILLVIGSGQIDRSAIEFACYVGEITNSRLTGMFLENIGKEEISVTKRFYGSSVVETIAANNSADYGSMETAMEENIHFFKESCTKRGVICSVHLDRGAPIEEIITESRFADLIILNASISGNAPGDSTPTDFVKEIFAKSKCPVTVAPPGFDKIDEIICL